jgi:SAM-dependent methyltransferase
MATLLRTSSVSERASDEYLSATDTALLELLDRTAAQLDALDIGGMNAVVSHLNAVRIVGGAVAWQDTIDKVVTPHRIRSLLHQEPLTHRAFEKPRGYPGDAVLLDLIYGDNPLDASISPLGARIHAWTPSQNACRSVRERRQLLATLIDRISAERSMPRILSLACGHLREAQRSDAVRANEIGEIVAVDQDPLSLEIVARESNGARITPAQASIRRFIVAPTMFGEFDLIYSAGLYDYLDDATARRLTAGMFAALRPGGTLVVANFAPELRDIGYMEAIMDWRLIYRDERGVAAFCTDLPADLIREQRMERDSGGNVIYLTVRKC